MSGPRRRHVPSWLLGLALLALWTPPAFAAADRVAIVVGNAAYLQAPLDNPLNDSNAVAGAIQDLGFSTVILQDADAARMRQDMLGAIVGAKGADLVVFYYAGHGVQSGGINYLLPVDSRIASKADIEAQGLPLNAIVDAMGRAGIETGLIFLDACRSNPAAEEGIVEPGLAFMEQSVGEMVISYAASAGAVAYDGDGPNSPYSQALTEALDEPGLDIYGIMRKVRGRVREMTEGRQIPWVSGSVERKIVLNRDSSAGFREAAAFDPADPNWLDDTRWQTIATRSNPALFTQFLDDFPTSRYAVLARKRLEEAATLGRQAIPVNLAYSETPAAAEDRLIDPLAERITACDRLAAGNRDPLRIVPGVPLQRLDAQEAILACTGDLAAHPDEPRLLYQLARALSHAERWREASHFAGLAAERGYPDAYALLAWMSAEGHGVEAEPRRAVALWRRGAELGSPNARANLGRSYRDGFGVDVSMPDALHWFRLAALTGEMIAADDLGNLYKKGESIAADPAKALDWYNLGASLGSSNAMTNLGSLYRDGVGVERDARMAKHWYERASDEGNRFAPFHLARLLLAEDAKANAVEALNLFLLAGNRGFAEGFTRAAKLYAEAEGADRRLEEAYFFASLARGSGDPKAAAVLKKLQGTLDPAALGAAEAKADLWLAQNGDMLRINRFAK